MTTRQRSLLVHALLVAVGTILTMIALGIVYRVGHASAQGLGAPAAAAPSDDPAGFALQLYEAIRTGKGTVAIGVALMLLVWGLRNGLGTKVPWFKTPIGGYVLGFSIPALVYLGTAFGAGQPLTMGLVLNMLGAAWVAAGGWEHLRDALSPKAPPAAAVEPAK